MCGTAIIQTKCIVFQCVCVSVRMGDWSALGKLLDKVQAYSTAGGKVCLLQSLNHMKRKL